jgi:hypothetical protein
VAKVDEGHDRPGASAPQVLTFGSPSIGEILAERYQLETHVGTDTLGRQLYKGMDVILRRPVAVVLRYPGGDAAGEMLAGAVAASRIVHPHLVGVYDAIDEHDRAYVVREWVEGASLRNHLADGPLDPGRAIAIGWAVTDAVAALHATGMAHGNIHPGSVLIANDGRVVLADARADDAATPDLDIRAIGGVMYAVLTAHWPHAEVGRDPLPDAVRDNSGNLAAPRQIRAGVPAELDALTADLLNHDLAVPSADALAAELARYDHTTTHGSFFDAEGSLDLDAFDRVGSVHDGRPRSGRRKLAVVVGGLVVLALVGTAAVAQLIATGDSPLTGRGNHATSAPAKAPTTSKPTVLKIAGDKVRIVDPPPGTREELADAAKVVDDNPNTVWHTSHYKGSPNFGGTGKPGMGVLLDLGGPKKVASVEVRVLQPGATIELRGGDTDPGDSSAGDDQIVKTYKPIGGAQPNVNSLIAFNGADDPVSYLLIWVTVLPPDGGQFMISISDITVKVL